jgi:hypothetical protein
MYNVSFITPEIKLFGEMILKMLFQITLHNFEKENSQ